MAKGGLLSSIKSDVEKTGNNRGKFFYVKSGAKARIRFLQDMDGDNSGRLVKMHDRWDPQLKVPCKKNFDEDADCQYCEMEDVRNRNQYAWCVWDYEANEVKIFMYPSNNCSPIPALAALYETYGTITDRDFSISRSGQGTNTSYSIIPLDKSRFRNDKAKPFSEKAFWKAVADAFPDGSSKDDEDDDEEEEVTTKKSSRTSKGTQQKAATKSKAKPKDDDDDDDLPWEDDEEEAGEYDDMTPKELYTKCRERDIVAKPRMEAAYYIKKLEKWDAENKDEDDEDFWGDEDE